MAEFSKSKFDKVYIKDLTDGSMKEISGTFSWSDHEWKIETEATKFPKCDKEVYLPSSAQVTFTLNDVNFTKEIYKTVYGSDPYQMSVVDWLGTGTSSNARDNMDRAKDLGKVVPGLQELVKYPCDCISPVAGSVWEAIIHLNDSHSSPKQRWDANLGTYEIDNRVWIREDIADWLDSLSVDLRVQNDKKED
jgi:hypothetical protein